MVSPGAAGDLRKSPVLSPHKTQLALNSLAVQVRASGCHAYLLSSPSGANDPAQCLLEGCRREPAHQAARRADEQMPLWCEILAKHPRGFSGTPHIWAAKHIFSRDLVGYM